MQRTFILRFVSKLNLISFCIYISLCDLVHDVQTVFHICKLLRKSGNLALNMSGAPKTPDCEVLTI